MRTLYQTGKLTQVSKEIENNIVDKIQLQETSHHVLRTYIQKWNRQRRKGKNYGEARNQGWMDLEPDSTVVI